MMEKSKVIFYFFNFSTLITGFAFVDFETMDQLTAAMEKTLSMGGRDLRTRIDEKRSRPPREDRGGGFGGQKRNVVNSN